MRIWLTTILLASGCVGEPSGPDAGPELVRGVEVEPGAPEPQGPAPIIDALVPAALPNGMFLYDAGLLQPVRGVTSTIRVTVTDDISAFMILAYGQPGAWVIPAEVVDPDGTVLVSDDLPEDVPPLHVDFARGFPGQLRSVNRVNVSAEHGAWLVPNTSLATMKPGVWEVSIGQYSIDLQQHPPAPTAVDQAVHVFILMRTAATEGRLDVAVHLTGSGGLTAASAPGNAVVQNVLGSIADNYAAVGVTLGEVSYHDVAAAFQELSLADETCDRGELDALFAASPARAGLPLFFIDHFSCIVNGNVDIGGGFSGLSAGVPGLPYVHGGIHAGVVIALDGFNLDPDPISVVASHEIGHYLGLYHARESPALGLPVFDNIPDTPDDVDAVQHNLMYYAADRLDQTTLSAGQGSVVASNPWVTE